MLRNVGLGSMETTAQNLRAWGLSSGNWLGRFARE